MKKYLLLADLHVSIVKILETQGKEIYLKMYTKGKSFSTDEDFDSLIKQWDESDDESILSVNEVEDAIKAIIDLAVSEVLELPEYDREICSVSSAIYYRLICTEDPVRFDRLRATKKLESYYQEQFSVIGGSMNINYFDLN